MPLGGPRGFGGYAAGYATWPSYRAPGAPLCGPNGPKGWGGYAAGYFAWPGYRAPCAGIVLPVTGGFTICALTLALHMGGKTMFAPDMESTVCETLKANLDALPGMRSDLDARVALHYDLNAKQELTPDTMGTISLKPKNSTGDCDDG